MTNDDLPSLFSVADAAAGRAQRRHFIIQRLELVSIAASAVVLEFSWSTDRYNVAGFVGAAMLTIALAVRTLGHLTGYESRWHRYRSTAEAVKASAWQYAVGGGRYPADLSEQQAHALLVEAVSELVEQTGGDAADLAASTSDDLSRLRQRPFEERRKVYIEHRLRQQRDWYSEKAAINRQATRLWSGTVIGLETLALAMAVARGFRWFEFDWTGVLGAVAAAGLAWHQGKQHSYLAATYTSATARVAALTLRFERDLTVQDWPSLVDEAEEFFASEHALWLHRRIRS